MRRRGIKIASILVMANLTMGWSLFGTSNPTEEDGKAAMSDRVSMESDGRLKMESFRKTNGQNKTMAGAEVYILEFETIIEAVESCSWLHLGSSLEFDFKTAKLKTPKGEMEKILEFGLNPFSRPVHAGEQRKIAGRLIFEMTDNGWRLAQVLADDIKLTRSELEARGVDLTNNEDVQVLDRFLRQDNKDLVERVWAGTKKGRHPYQNIKNDPKLLAFSERIGTAVYPKNCGSCHGSSGLGTKGAPNLADDDWLWGGSPEEIFVSISSGIRDPQDSNSRFSQMPRFGVDKILSPEQISDAAEYVLSLSGANTDVAAAGRGKGIYEEQCAACHGKEGKGWTELGAPNLADSIWLYGGAKEDVVESIRTGREGEGKMPGFLRLDPVVIWSLVIYLESLRGSQ